ncbi:MAG TPA: enoyl-CoA hydratase [Candidatus Dormibacteraeota bacterium]
MISTEPVLYGVAEGVATITLNRPDRLNAWTREMGEGWSSALEQAARDPEVRAVVVTGAGKGFCAGADISLLESIGGGAAVVGEERRVLPTEAIEVPKPVIAAVNGSCAGLGLVIALCCDLRFAASGAKFTSAFARRGLIAEYGSSWLLPRLVGTARALDILLSARVFLAEEALEMGLVNRVVPGDQVLGAATAYARDLAANCPPGSMAVIKRQVYGHASTDLQTAVRESIKLMEESLETEDFKEGVASYVEQRPPRFRPLS